MTHDSEPGMAVELLADGDGLAIIGEPGAVELFVSSAGVASKDLALNQRVGTALNAGSGIAQAGSEIVAQSGKWVKLTDESAKAMKVSTLMTGSTSDVSRAVLTDKGKITGLLEIVKPGSIGSMMTNPAMLAGAAGIMAQLAMQQTMEEITDYLAIIDEKVDDVLRAQKDSALAEMIGVGFVIDEAMTIREHVGRVSDVTWSKVQGSTQTVARTQAYALRQLDALAEKLEKKSKVGDLAKISKDAEVTVQEWLAVLARCFQLQDAIAVLELDRVLDSTPDDLDRHRKALQAARAKRRAHIAATTENLLIRIETAAVGANAQVLLHPVASGAVVHSSNHVATGVIAFHEHLGIDAGRQSLEAKKWTVAAAETRDKAIETGTEGIGAVKRFGSKSFDGAKATTSKFSSDFAQRMTRRRDRKTADDDSEDFEFFESLSEE
ncbi:hypothetical protein [Microbacterium sp. R86528]|uniref:hypothetical protein n=1 Tax=Microbacterium sp. R86528 TaxID=3093864 RepID=UPI0037C8A34F